MPYYRTVYQIEVLSRRSGQDVPVYPRKAFAKDPSAGDYQLISHEEITAEQAAELVEAKGYDPAFITKEV